VIHFNTAARRCDILFAIGESRDGQVHGGLIINGTQGGGFNLSWLNYGYGATYNILVLHRKSDSIRVSGCDSMEEARRLLCAYVGGTRFVSRTLTRKKIKLDALASCMTHDLKKTFAVSMSSLNVYQDTNCLLFVATAAAAAGVPLRKFRALVPAVQELTLLDHRLQHVLVNLINGYLDGQDADEIINR
jgi:hypothetical protein